jgi:transcriptional regulator with XRE-family HTH domain
MKQEAVIIEADIGKRIKTLRTERGITLDQLARQTGFTKGYLSKVEKSEKAPPVSTLLNLAKALDVTLSVLLGEESQQSSLCLVRKDERPLMARDGTAFGYSYEAVAYKFPDRLMEAFVLTLPLSSKKKTIYQHEGQEILFVLQGTMKFFYGSEEYIVHEGDCIYFDSGIPHLGVSISPEEVKCFMVSCNFTGKERTIQTNGAS